MTVKFSTFLLCVAALAATDAPKEIKPRLPLLNSVFPQGAQAGTRLQVEVLGEHLDRAQSVRFLDSSIRGHIHENSYTRLALDFEVERDAELGPHYFRIITPRGASNILLFRVCDQPHINEKEPNSTFEEAQEVKLPVTINGRLNVDGDFDFFRFHVERGQTWIFDLRAARNGNGLDAALILLDSRGRKLAHVEDTFIWDPFLAYTFPEAGDYYVVVQPTHVRLDPNFAYQLEIRTTPFVETISPISVQPGATIEATVYGAGISGTSARLWFDEPSFSGEVLDLRGASAQVKIHTAQNAREGPHEFAIINSGGRSNTAMFLVDSTPVHRGGEQISPPVSINGVARYRQPDRFSFDVEKGQTLVFEVRAQRFGSPVDSILRIVDRNGKQIAVNDDANFPGVQFNKDSRISHRFREAGRYYVEIRNLWKTTGEDFPYQLVVRAPKPECQLMLGSDNPYVYSGGSGTLKVTVVREDGYDGPVSLQVKGLPEGITAEPAEIPPGKNEGEIRFHAPGAKPGTSAHIQVIAAQAKGPAWRSVRISSGGGEGATFAIVQTATLAVIEKPLFSLEAQLTNVNLVRGSSAEIAVAIRRAEDFNGPIHFGFENLPPGVAAAEVTALPGTESAKLILTAEKGARAGRFSRIAILGRTEEGRVEEAPRITVTVD